MTWETIDSLAVAALYFFLGYCAGRRAARNREETTIKTAISANNQNAQDL